MWTQFSLCLITTSLYVWTLPELNVWMQLFIQFIYALGVIDIALTVYLMIEHNLNGYLKYLEFMEKTRMSCLCKCIIENARPYVEDSKDKETRTNDHKSIQQTNTVDNLMTEVERIEEYQSEYTKSTKL